MWCCKTIVMMVMVCMAATAMATDWSAVEITAANCQKVDKQSWQEYKAEQINKATWLKVRRRIGLLEPDEMTAGQLGCRLRARVYMAHSFIDNKQMTQALTAVNEAEITREGLPGGARAMARLVRERAFRLMDMPTSAVIELDMLLADFDGVPAYLQIDAIRRRLNEHKTTRELELTLMRKLIPAIAAAGKQARWTIHDLNRIRQSGLTPEQREEFAVLFRDAADITTSDETAVMFYKYAESYLPRR